MSVDLKTFKKLESLPAATLAGSRADNERLVVMVRLRDGAKQPSYILPRAKMGPRILTGEIKASDLVRIESDPDIESVALSRPLPLVE
jgi:hypothetical protein